MAFEEIYDDTPREIPAEQVCQALLESLEPFSQELIGLIDGEAGSDRLPERYMRWAVPTAMLSRAILEEMEEDEAVSFPGLAGLVESCPELDSRMQDYLKSPSRDELLEMASLWLSVRAGCQEMLEALRR